MIYDNVITCCARFTYRLGRLKPRASKARGPSAKVYNIFDTVICLSYTCCHSHDHLINTSQAIKFCKFKVSFLIYQ